MPKKKKKGGFQKQHNTKKDLIREIKYITGTKRKLEYLSRPELLLLLGEVRQEYDI